MPAFSRGGAGESHYEPNLHSQEPAMPTFTLQQLQAIVPQMAIVMMQQQQTLSELVAQHQVHYKISKAHPLTISMLKCGKEYSEAVRNVGKNHTHGPLGSHLLSCIVNHLIDAAEVTCTMELTDFRSSILNLGPLETAKVLAVCRLTKLFDRESMKLVFAIRHDVAEELLTGLAQIGFQRLYGAAPRTNLVRNIQTALDDARARRN
jgi:hypothetical protein